MTLNDSRDELFEVAHVAGVIARQQIILHYVVEVRRVVWPKLPDEMFRQQGYVFASLAQGRQAFGPTRDAVIQIAPEPAVRLFFNQIAVGRADEPEVRIAPCVAADPFVGSLLRHAQQLGL